MSNHIEEVIREFPCHEGKEEETQGEMGKDMRAKRKGSERKEEGK